MSLYKELEKNMENCKLFAELVKATLDLEQKYLILETKLKEQELLIERYESKIASLVEENIEEKIQEKIDYAIEDVDDKITELTNKVDDLDSYVDDVKDDIKTLEDKVEALDEETICDSVISEIKSRL